MEHYPLRSDRAKVRGQSKEAGNELPRELMLNLLAQGYPLEELLEFFPMFTLDQLLLLIENDYIL